MKPRELRALAFSALAGILASNDASACAVGVTGLSLGPINPLHGQAVTGAGRITVACDPDTPYTLSLSTGVSGTWERHMAGPASTLLYNIYLDPLHSRVWGDGSLGSEAVGGTGSGESMVHDVYARVPAQPLAPGGHYVDTIVVTVTY